MYDGEGGKSDGDGDKEGDGEDEGEEEGEGICNSVFGAPKIICVEPTQKKRSHIKAVTNLKSQICDCDSQTQMRYGNAPLDACQHCCSGYLPMNCRCHLSPCHLSPLLTSAAIRCLRRQRSTPNAPAFIAYQSRLTTLVVTRHRRPTALVAPLSSFAHSCHFFWRCHWQSIVVAATLTIVELSPSFEPSLLSADCFKNLNHLSSKPTLGMLPVGTPRLTCSH
jgi:hypothetical protein